MIQENDVVITKRDLLNLVLKLSKGVVVIVYQKPRVGYEIEFFDELGETLAVVTVYPEDILKIDSY